MNKNNSDNSTIRHYKGIIRDLQAQLKNAVARIKKLEEKVRKIPSTNPHSPSDMEIFASDDINRGVSPTSASGSSGVGLTASEIKKLIEAWIENGQLPIPIHDHTDNAKGGDAYANKGSALQ